VSESKHPGGRPTEVEGGRRMNLYLDRESVQTAKEIGNGNMSEGIRGALRAVKALRELRRSNSSEPNI
jgi:hypothetical protein